MSKNKWVYDILAEDDNYNWVQVNEDNEGFKFFVVHISNHSLQLMMCEKDLEDLYKLLKQVFEGLEGSGMVAVRGIRMDGGKQYLWREQICHDCGAKVGELHQLGCDMEDCPICDGQLITCSEGHFELVEQGKYPRVPYIQPFVCCAICGVLFPEMFSVPNSEWDKFVPPRLKGEWVCRQCYDELKKIFPDGWRSVK